MKRFLAVTAMMLLVARLSAAQITKGQLLEMVEKKVDVNLIVSLIEKDCVDFDVDAAVILELSKKIPNPVLQAAINCRKGGETIEGAQKQPTKAESLECLIYRELTSHPGLAGFPLVVDSIKNGYVTIVGVDSAAWAQEKTQDLSSVFDYIERHRGLVSKAKETVKKLPGVKDVEFLVYNNQGTGAVTVMQERGMENACAKKGTAKITSLPLGVKVSIDDQARGVTPLELELVVGEHSLRFEHETFATFEGRIVIEEGKTTTTEAKLDKLGELLVSSDVPGATVTVNGELKGQTPQTLYLPSGEYAVQVMAARRLPHSEKVSVALNQSKAIQATLVEIPREEYCYTFGLQGKVGDNFKALKGAMASEPLNLVVPLYQAVTSSLGRKLPSTHVINGEKFGYEPRYGTSYVYKQADLLGRELGGLAIGETVSDVTSTPPGLVKVEDMSKKGNSLRIELVYSDGRRNSIFFDFDRKVDDLDLEDLYDAFCLCFSMHESFKLNS